MALLRIAGRLSTLSVALMLWLLLASIMGTSAYSFDSEQAPCSFSAFNSQTWVQTSRSDFSLDGRDQVDIDNRPGNVILAGRTEFLYAFQGSGTRNFLRYNITSSTWSYLAQAPAALRDEGGALASDGDRYIYAIHGGNRLFWRFDTIANSWTVMPRTPSAVRLGGGLTYDGKGCLYTLQGADNTGFWRFNISTNSWTTLARTPAAVSDGGCLVHDQGNYIYALQGNGQANFWRYNVSANAWTTLTQVPLNVRYGGALTFDDVDSIFAVPGWSQSAFLRYSISENRWYLLSPLPAQVSTGGSLAFSYPGAVYAFSGSRTPAFFRFDIPNNVWTTRTNAPGNIAGGGALASGSTSHSRTGSLTSFVLDTGTAGSRLLGFYWNELLRPGTDIIFDIRASDTLSSGVPSSSWISLGGTSPVTAGLPSGRYIQWRATLTTTNIHLTPILQEVRVYYV